MDVRTEKDAEDFIRRIADYQRISAILWLVISIVQICSLVAIIAGLCNLFTSLSRFGAVKKILTRATDVPSEFEGLRQLIVIGIINFFLGAVVGVVFVGLDLYIRDQILKNRQVFSGQPVLQAEPTLRASLVSSQYIEQLERLVGLYDRGFLTTEEFVREKERLLGA